MAEPQQKIDRHADLWKQGSKGLGRLGAGIVLFAFLVVFWVFTPLVDDSVDLSGQRSRLHEVRNGLRSIETEKAELEPVETRLKEIERKIKSQPWTHHKDDLIAEIAMLNGAYEELHRPPEELKGAMIREARAQVPHGPIKDALERFGSDSVALTSAPDRESLEKRLIELYRDKVQEAADRAVANIERSVAEHVVKPAEQLDASPERARKMADAFSRELEKWSSEIRGNDDWFQSVRSKNKELDALTSLLRDRQVEFLRPVQVKLRALEKAKKPLAQKAKKLETEQGDLVVQIDSLEDRLEKILPAWARGLVSAPEMLQLFPFVLIVLVAYVSYRVRSVRAHYLIVRGSHEPPDLSFRDAGMSSVWTLVWRGRFGTTLTLLLYVGGGAVVWWLFEHGVGQLTTWLGTGPADVHLSRGLVARMIFCLAMLGSTVVLIREWRIARSYCG